MKQIDIWNFELAINNLLFDENKKNDGMIALTTMYSKNREFFDNFINELVTIKEVSRKLQENSSEKEILNAIKETKQKIKERTEMPSFIDKKDRGPLALKEDGRRQPSRLMKNRELEINREQNSEKINRPINRPTTSMHKKEEIYPYLMKNNLQIEYEPIRTYSNFNELDKDIIQMFCYTDKRMDVAFNIFMQVVEMSNGRLQLIDVAERYKTDDNSKFLGNEYIEIRKTLSVSKLEMIKMDKVYFSLNDNFHNSPNSFKRCLKVIAEHISNEKLGVFKEPSEFRYIVIHTQEKRLAIYRLIASVNN